MNNWWANATTEQKLAQIDGAIAVGMTSKQCSMNLLLDEKHNNAMRQWALRHGRHFKGTHEPHVNKARSVAQKTVMQVRYREAGFSDSSHKDAYDIFGSAGSQSQNLFAAHPYDGEEFG